MKRIQLQVETREKSGKEDSKRLRKTGYVPGIFYSPHDKNNILLKILEKELFRFLSDKKHAHGIIDLKIKTDDEKEVTRLALMKDFQYDSLLKRINHFDFYGVTMKEKVTLEVPIILEGEPKGIKEGGILDISLREVEVECLPADAPEAITIDISEMSFNDVITLQDVVLPKGVKLLTDINRTIASVVAPSKVEEKVPEKEAEEVTEGAPEAKIKAKEAKAEEEKEEKE
ncbi:MAG: 50S ribosomal protein L25 [Atribacterota bacterium]|nr:50S ribosomal protein L25 [Atribacterota bacterium]MDD5638114.1 50S ribosomal protein L25 [Atribacterota bacterium]